MFCLVRICILLIRICILLVVGFYFMPPFHLVLTFLGISDSDQRINNFLFSLFTASLTEAIPFFGRTKGSQTPGLCFPKRGVIPTKSTFERVFICFTPSIENGLRVVRESSAPNGWTEWSPWGH